MKSLIRSFLLLVSSTIFFHIFAVLLGAPLLTSIKETFLFASILTLCSALPSVIVISSWQDFFRIHFDSAYFNNKERTIAILARTCIFGAWLGAFPIPLDWDRWWQEWPITCVVGCIVGFLSGFVYSRISVLRGTHKHSATLDFKPKSV